MYVTMATGAVHVFVQLYPCAVCCVDSVMKFSAGVSVMTSCRYSKCCHGNPHCPLQSYICACDIPSLSLSLCIVLAVLV